MTIESVRKELDSKGYLSVFHRSESYRSNIEELILEMKESGEIESLSDAGIKFMKEDYIYIRKGNPDGIHVVDEYGESWLEK